MTGSLSGEDHSLSNCADQDIKRSINALVVSSHLVSALIRNPGPMCPHKSMVDAAKIMLAESDEVTIQLLSYLSLDEIPSAKYKIMRMVIQAVSDKWRSSSDNNAPSADVKAMIPVWKEIATHNLPLEFIDEQPKENYIFKQIALLSAMHPVLREIDVFDLFNDPKKAAIHARDQIIAISENSIDEIAGPAATEDSKKQLLSSLLTNAGTIYSSAWRKHANSILSEMRALPPKEQHHFVVSHPDGFSLDEIDRAFVDSFKKLVELVKFLAPSKNTVLEKSTSIHLKSGLINDKVTPDSDSNCLR
jgi:hypothetical protein